MNLAFSLWKTEVDQSFKATADQSLPWLNQDSRSRAQLRREHLEEGGPLRGLLLGSAHIPRYPEALAAFAFISWIQPPEAGQELNHPQAPGEMDPQVGPASGHQGPATTPGRLPGL